MANLLDRYFVHYGYVYDIVVVVIFLLSFWYIDKSFIKKIEREIEKDQTTVDLFAFLDKFERK